MLSICFEIASIFTLISIFAVLPANMSKISSVIICGPSGVGKGTMIKCLLDKYSGKLELSVSHTSRQPRPGEVDGLHYHFVSKEFIEDSVLKNMFLEHAHVHGNIYGTSKRAVDKILSKNRICLLDLDVHGVKQMKSISFPAKYVFIAPPSLQELESRLRGRGTESESDVLRRLKNAEREVEYGLQEGNFDIIVENKSLNESLALLTPKLEQWFPTILHR